MLQSYLHLHGYPIIEFHFQKLFMEFQLFLASNNIYQIYKINFLIKISLILKSFYIFNFILEN